MCATYADKQNRLHFKSFANRIFTGIREINPEYAEKRAVWELFQNALDTVEGHGIIEISSTEGGLIFKHNGRAFTDDEFGGLIKQFSVGKAYGDNTEKVGQYGTGFISTHIYGKKIIINGSVKTDDGSFRILKDFEIDRDADSIEDLTDKLLTQDRIFDSLCRDSESSVPAAMPFTTFEYLTSQINRPHIDAMMEYIRNVLPFIFCFNDKLKEVTLTAGEIIETYKRDIVSTGNVQLLRNQDLISIPVLSNDDQSIRIILGSSENNLDGIPKQFLFYPLMETSEAGINFIIHANDFKPNKERDYLYKATGNDELRADVKMNEGLLAKGYSIVLEKIVQDDSLSIMEISKLAFNIDDTLFEIEVKHGYIKRIWELDRIKIAKEKYSLGSFGYFDASVFELAPEIIEAAYTVISQFRTLPPFEEFSLLSKRVNNWNSFMDEKLLVLTIGDIGRIVAAEGQGNYFYMEDKEAFRMLIAEISKDINLLNELALIPNIHGEYKQIQNLVKWEQPEPYLVAVVDSIAAETSEKYIHDDFTDLAGITFYNLERFKDEFSKLCHDLIDGMANDNRVLIPGSTRFSMLIQKLKDFVALNKKAYLNVEIVEFFERIYKLEPQEAELSDTGKDVNYQPAIKLLAHLYIKGLANENIASHLDDIRQIVAIMFRNTKLKEELLHKLPCVPNQNYILKTQAELKRDEVMDEMFKDKYDEIVKGNCRSDIAHENFGLFLQHPGAITGEQLGKAIETALNEERKFIPIDISTLDIVLNLIEEISDKKKKWGQWLPNINSVKEELLMQKFQDGKTRSSLFSILTKDVKVIRLLGELAKVNDLEDLIKKGKEKQLEEQRQNRHLAYINHIGILIQDLIEKQLGVELAGTYSVMNSEEDKQLSTQEQQNGQDFIIYKNGIAIYYFEVKSKWDDNGRFALSKNQTEKCAKKKNEYAVISVNVDRYKRHHGLSTEDIRFEDLQGFVKVNDDLGEYFEKLVLENISKSETNDPKLIEYRGSIPQKMIDERGSDFNPFILKLIGRLKGV